VTRHFNLGLKNVYFSSVAGVVGYRLRPELYPFLTFHHQCHLQIYYRHLSPLLRKDAIRQKLTSGSILVSPPYKRLCIKPVEFPARIIYNAINKGRHSIHHDHALTATHAVSEVPTLSTYKPGTRDYLALRTRGVTKR
jgi:hypothetical protein